MIRIASFENAYGDSSLVLLCHPNSSIYTWVNLDDLCAAAQPVHGHRLHPALAESEIDTSGVLSLVNHVIFSTDFSQWERLRPFLGVTVFCRFNVGAYV